MYQVKTEWFDTPLVEACDIEPPTRTAVHPFLGAFIIAWLDAGNECTYNILIAPPGVGLVERIIEMIEI